MPPQGPSIDDTAAGAQGSEDTDRSWNGVERRLGDRRHRPTRLFAWPVAQKRRLGGRRRDDQEGYVDRYSRREVALVVSIFLLNVADAFFTMRWLARGGREANPVMDFFLDLGPGAFLVQKCLVVGAWLVLLLAHKNFRFARVGLYASFVVYALLLLLHFRIVALGIEPPQPEDERAIRGDTISERRVFRPAAG